MLTRLAHAAVIGVAIALPLTASAAPEPTDPKRRTAWHLYLTAREAYDLKRARGDEVLFVDVRDPVEIMFAGFTDVVDVNVPFLLANPRAMNEKKSVFLMEPNPDFAPGITRALAARGLGAAEIVAEHTRLFTF